MNSWPHQGVFLLELRAQWNPTWEVSPRHPVHGFCASSRSAFGVNVSVVQWHPFSLLFGAFSLFVGGCPTKNGPPQKGFPFFCRVTEQLRFMRQLPSWTVLAQEKSDCLQHMPVASEKSPKVDCCPDAFLFFGDSIINIHIYIYICTYIHIYIHTYIYICIHMYTCVFVHAFMLMVQSERYVHGDLSARDRGRRMGGLHGIAGALGSSCGVGPRCDVKWLRPADVNWGLTYCICSTFRGRRVIPQTVYCWGS